MRRNDNTDFLIYTTEEGGTFTVLGGYTLEQFEDIKKKRIIALRLGDSLLEIRPAFIAFAKGVDTWDFELDERWK